MHLVKLCYCLGLNSFIKKQFHSENHFQAKALKYSYYVINQSNVSKYVHIK